MESNPLDPGQVVRLVDVDVESRVVLVATAIATGHDASQGVAPS